MPAVGSLSLDDPTPTPTPAPTTAATASTTDTPVLPDKLPDSLLGFAHLVLATPDPAAKCALTREGVARMRAGKLKSIRPSTSEVRKARADGGLLDEPPRLQTAVTPGQVGKRGKGGSEKSRIMMLRECKLSKHGKGWEFADAQTHSPTSSNTQSTSHGTSSRDLPTSK
jgi:hypothetical protein